MPSITWPVERMPLSYQSIRLSMFTMVVSLPIVQIWLPWSSQTVGMSHSIRRRRKGAKEEGNAPAYGYHGSLWFWSLFFACLLHAAFCFATGNESLASKSKLLQVDLGFLDIRAELPCYGVRKNVTSVRCWWCWCLPPKKIDKIKNRTENARNGHDR